MQKNVVKFLLILLILVFAIPVSLQAFPTNALVLSHSMTFTTLTVNIVGVAGPSSYSPDTIVINSGDTVVWNNTDFTSHSATCGTGTPCGMWDTGLISGTSSPIPYTSFAVGTTHYYCSLHGDGPAGMYGAVIRIGTDVKDWQKMASGDKSEKESPKITQGPFGIMFVHPDPSSNKKTSDTLIQKNSSDSSLKDSVSKMKIGGSVELRAQVTK